MSPEVTEDGSPPMKIFLCSSSWMCAWPKVNCTVQNSANKERQGMVYWSSNELPLWDVWVSRPHEQNSTSLPSCSRLEIHNTDISPSLWLLEPPCATPNSGAEAMNKWFRLCYAHYLLYVTSLEDKKSECVYRYSISKRQSDESDDTWLIST